MTPATVLIEDTELVPKAAKAVAIVESDIVAN